ncbi:hypothetical protein D0525_01750 [Salmonella enterica]|uniref:hypothetical protein n=1 Tax=Salmonella enterica TaxID=28901 RepID=UPI00101063ED|nr:hypothetical protein [Salmonella enterica]RXO49298.1 hypothetical protein D0525_01750 [Salmonella enterica]
MEEISSEFTIAVESDLDKYSLIDFISKTIPGMVIESPLYLRYENTMITIEKNYDWNPDLINEDDGWLYYRYDITVFSREKTSYEDQQSLENILINDLRSAGYLAESIW